MTPSGCAASDGAFAQTYPQLVCQLSTDGATHEAVLAIVGAHRLAVDLFTAQFRPSLKPFVDHLVGTASVVHAHGGRDELVAAALLHAAYSSGRFVDGSTGASDANRQRVRDAVGREVELLVHDYDAFTFTVAAIRELLARPRQLGTRERELVMLRLANEVDDHLDHQLELCEEPTAVEQLPEGMELMCELGRGVGLEQLAATLGDLARVQPLGLPTGVRSAYGWSVLLMPHAETDRGPRRSRTKSLAAATRTVGRKVRGRR